MEGSQRRGDPSSFALVFKVIIGTSRRFHKKIIVPRRAFAAFSAHFRTKTGRFTSPHLFSRPRHAPESLSPA
jgi:hypothetical protein